MHMKKLSWLLILSGIIIAAVPIVGMTYTSFKQHRLMESWESILADAGSETTDPTRIYNELQAVFTEISGESSEVSPIAETTEENPNMLKEDAKQPISSSISNKTTNVIGRIIIEKIKVNIPIVEGASSESLKIGAGHIEGTSNIGEIGNAAIAAHRSHTFGRFFNRLDEIEIGDEILIETKKDKYIYKVYVTKIVEPTDVSVLNRSKTERVLTLVTCDPVYGATHRLIVHAKVE